MGSLVRRLDAKLYPDFPHRWDDTLFRQRILSHLGSGDLDILDLGAGAGIVEQMDFRGHARRICGIDPDPRVVENPYLDEGRVGVGESIPYPDGSFDLVFADNVLEHLPDPARVFAEVARVLRGGGRLSREDAEQGALCPADRSADAACVSPLGGALAGTGVG